LKGRGDFATYSCVLRRVELKQGGLVA
jgi:hypothetical protein